MPEKSPFSNGKFVLEYYNRYVGGLVGIPVGCRGYGRLAAPGPVGDDQLLEGAAVGAPGKPYGAAGS